MSCQERLSHAIQIDKIKIFPNSSMVIEKRQKRNIRESHEERVESKADKNAYNKDYFDREEYENLDNMMAHEQ
jgi:hypothetical protein